MPAKCASVKYFDCSFNRLYVLSIEGFTARNILCRKHPVNAAVQYEARTLSEEEGRKVQETEEFAEFVNDAAPRFCIFLISFKQNLSGINVE